MKMHITLIVAIVCLSCQKIPIDKPDTLADELYLDHPKHSTYQAALENYRRNTTSPGSIMLVKKGNEALWIGASGVANLEHQTPMRTNHLFRTGSITKMLTAVVILQLVDEGKLTLENKISGYAPSLVKHVSNHDAITIRHLLAHQSGIFDPANESLQYQSDILNHPTVMAAMTVEEKMKKYVSGKKLKFQPGSSYAYSNTNYWLLGAIAEEATGKKLSQLFSERIFAPLGMNHSYLEKRDDRNVARGYVDLYNNGHLMDVTLFDKAEGEDEADGGLISTAQDLYKFMNGLFDGLLITPALLEEMKRIQLTDCNSPECEYGLGLELWQTKAGTAYGHNGALLGIEANVLYYPEKKSVTVIYKNNGNGSVKEFIEDFIAQ